MGKPWVSQSPAPSTLNPRPPPKEPKVPYVACAPILLNGGLGFSLREKSFVSDVRAISAKNETRDLKSGHGLVEILRSTRMVDVSNVHVSRAFQNSLNDTPYLMQDIFRSIERRPPSRVDVDFAEVVGFGSANIADAEIQADVRQRFALRIFDGRLE